MLDEALRNGWMDGTQWRPLVRTLESFPEKLSIPHWSECGHPQGIGFFEGRKVTDGFYWGRYLRRAFESNFKDLEVLSITDLLNICKLALRLSN